MKWTQLHAQNKTLIPVHPETIRQCGPAAAIMLSQMFYWTGKAKNSKTWFFKTSTEFERETGIPPRTQLRIRNKLRLMGLIDEFYNRPAHKMFFRVNTNALDALITITDEHQTKWPVPPDKVASPISETTHPEPILDPDKHFMPITDKQGNTSKRLLPPSACDNL